jgi:hypothetical protein
LANEFHLSVLFWRESRFSLTQIMNCSKFAQYISELRYIYVTIMSSGKRSWWTENGFRFLMLVPFCCLATLKFEFDNVVFILLLHEASIIIFNIKYTILMFFFSGFLLWSYRISFLFTYENLFHCEQVLNHKGILHCICDDFL